MSRLCVIPLGNEVPGALYWRGRLYEDVEHNFGQALNYYKSLSETYPNSYYAMLAASGMVVHWRADRRLHPRLRWLGARRWMTRT